MADAYTPPTGTSSQYPANHTGLDALGAEMKGLRRQQADTRSRTLQSAAISAGGLTIKDGGGVTVKDGGVIRAEQPEGGYAEMYAGRVRFAANGDDAVGYISAGNSELSSGAIWPGMWIYPPYRPGLSRETRLTLLGQTQDPDGQVVTGAIFASTDGNVQLEGHTGVLLRNNGEGSARLISTEGQVQITSGIDQVFVSHGTTSSAANAVLSESGLVQRSTSARKYKRDIEDYAPDPDAVLALRPRTWRDRGEVERDPDTTTRYPGFIAEEVHALGLTDLVVYDADGNPDALNYDRFVAALIPVLRRQQDQIDTMRAELDELRSA